MKITLLGGRATRDEVGGILAGYYGGYMSPLHTEYKGLINKYLTLSGQAVLP